VGNEKIKLPSAAIISRIRPAWFERSGRATETELMPPHRLLRSAAVTTGASKWQIDLNETSTQSDGGAFVYYPAKRLSNAGQPALPM
jgi:hypothetical protein